MKILYSSSSPSSSINANLYNSKNATAGCLAGILRRLLCSGSLPTHPSDHVRDSGQCGFFESVECDNVRSLKSNDKIKRPASPGIVARLMGLSSMPDADSTPNSIRRSRSMNSVDYGSVQKRHGRLKTSLSFREASSTSLQVENEEFLILSFENGGETTELESNPTKPEDIRRMHSCGKQRVDENQDGVIKEVTNEEKSKWSSFGEYYEESSRVKVSHVTPDLDLEAIKFSQCTNHKGDEGKLTKKKKKKKKRKNSQSASNKVESQSESENSSPVSVLEVGEFDLSDEVPRSEEDGKLKESSNSRRKLLQELESYEILCSQNNEIVVIDDEESKKIDIMYRGSGKKDGPSARNLNLWEEICRLAEGDMSESKWAFREMLKLEDFEEVGAEIGVRILDQLLNELVDVTSENF